ncbi:Protein of unknown function [Gryllus bimaculatus]|nr:Protein of unknown function [Gryllus bimaculatus]
MEIVLLRKAVLLMVFLSFFFFYLKKIMNINIKEVFFLVKYQTVSTKILKNISEEIHNNTTVHLVSFVRVSLNGCAISSTYFHLLEEQKDLWNCEITKTCVPEDTTLLHTQLQYFLAHSNLKTVLIQGNQFSTNGFANNNVSMEHLIDYTYFNAGFYLIVFDLCFLQSLNFIT